MIHPTALISPGARLARGVQVGPYTVIEEHVEIGEGTLIGSHCVIKGHTRIGKNNRIAQFVSLGEAPQDKKYREEPTRLEIGDSNVIREFCTFNRGTVQDAGVTSVGDDNWIMAYVHLAHDCQVGSHTIFANNTQLAGHVHIGDWVILGGFTQVHQFCSIGAHAFTAASSLVLRDIPPYVMAAGSSAEPRSVNTEGLRRRGFSPKAITAIRRAYKTLYRSGLTLAEAAKALETQAQENPELRILVDFISASRRSLSR
ncbi:MAG: acyl-ACP--UDP-N-acetylglucosamine O-acyltransferase [Burkholderiales bacterium]